MLLTYSSYIQRQSGMLAGNKLGFNLFKCCGDEHDVK